MSEPTKSFWIVAIILTRRESSGSITWAQTITWRSGATEDEAKGAAVTFAMAERPGFAIEMITTAKIDQLQSIPGPDERRGYCKALAPGEPWLYVCNLCEGHKGPHLFV